MSEQAADHLGLVPIFADLQADELPLVAQYLSARHVPAGEFVFREGEKGDFLCFVASGTLDVIKLNQNAQPVVISRLAKGSSIGEMALLDKLRRSASVRACVASELLVLDRDSFERLLESQPGIGIKVLKGIALLLSTNLRKTSDKLAEFMPPLA